MVAQARVTFVQTVADLARFLKRDCLAERCADESEVAKQYFTEFLYKCSISYKLCCCFL